MHRLGIADHVVSAVYPDKTELQRLYRASVALLYPSVYEGFGLPPLEALASGILAVSANTSSLPEVVGDAGIMLDPTDSDAWTDCILRIAVGLPDRQILSARGKRRASEFSWAETVRRHVDIYRRLS